MKKTLSAFFLSVLVLCTAILCCMSASSDESDHNAHKSHGRIYPTYSMRHGLAYGKGADCRCRT